MSWQRKIMKASVALALIVAAIAPVGCVVPSDLDLMDDLLTPEPQAPAAAAPPNVYRSADGQFRPAPGFDWVDPNDPNDLSVRPIQGSPPPPQQAATAGVLVSLPGGGFQPAPGYVWVNPNDPNDLRVQRVEYAPPPPQPTSGPGPRAIDMHRATNADLAGYYRMTDPSRTPEQYHADAILYGNGTGLCREFANGQPFPVRYTQALNDDGYLPVLWRSDRIQRVFVFDWSCNNRWVGLGVFQGETQGNTNDFTLSGRWASGNPGQIRFQRVR